MTPSESKIKRPAFIILGAPGSGKGTQGQILGSVPRFFHCACGDVFRSPDTRTALGQQFVDYSSRGELVPDELTIALWKAQIDNLSDAYFYKPILEFYPDELITTINATQPPVKVLAEMIRRITSLPVYDAMAKVVV